MENVQIQVCNWLLTRKCNLECDYCRIVRDYQNQPEEYPLMSYYYKNEISGSEVIEILKRLHKHNPRMFHIFYGGEPTLYKDLEKIIDFCNKNDVKYTIITNSTNVAKERVSNLIKEVGTLKGLTASVDPVLISGGSGDIKLKTNLGFELLMSFKGVVEDLVAEITCTSENIDNLLPTVSKLSSEGIWSDITVVEVAVTNYYDFSNCTDKKLLVKKSQARDIFQVLLSGSYLIHMKEKLIPLLYQNLPQRYSCKIGKIPIHNLSIDADANPRLCLRIRGVKTPSFKMLSYISKDGKFTNEFISNIRSDFTNLCRCCIWTCPMSSELTLTGSIGVEHLLHWR